MTKILTIVGTRPEAIKLAPVIKEFSKPISEIEVIVCSTGQHREMLHQVFSIFDLKPDIELDVMRPNQSLASLTSILLTELDRVLRDEKPDWILAQGDTTSVMVASLLAFYNRVSFAHLEAGLRTGDLEDPFPEEANRRIADLLATLYFAPTKLAKNSLLAEHVPESKILLTGNTVVDALHTISSRSYRPSPSVTAILRSRRIVLITLHRRESFGEALTNICHAIRDLSSAFPETDFIYPVHLNPNVQRIVRDTLSDIENIKLIDPVDYPSLIYLLRNACLVMTDSGGIQEEAPSFSVPVLVLRNTTERPEGITAGVARLIGTDYDRVLREASILLTNDFVRKEMSNRPNLYGDGRASKRVVDAILGRKVDEFVEQ